MRFWSLRNCVTGLTQLGCISLSTISHWQCRVHQAEEAVSGWATYSPQLEGDFIEFGNRHNRIQGGSSPSIHLPSPSGLVTTKRGTKARAAKGFDCSCLEEKCVVCMLVAFSATS